MSRLPDKAGAPAVVVGLCAHGLAIARALGKAGIPVIALEANPSLPGYYTRYARVVRAKDINGTGLIDALREISAGLPSPRLPVLILTNDNMVRTVGQHWSELQACYRMSWSDCCDRVLPLLDKSALESHCQQIGLPYPKTLCLNGADELEGLSAAGLDFPMIVKPSRPLSGFKVRLVEDRSALNALIRDYEDSLPFLLQQWIPGKDSQLLFTAFYLDRGRILATFEGRKLASRPAALGQTTIAESQRHAVALALAKRFFEPLSLSGPVSLEIKLDASGCPWVIEPTLGRTDYWLDCCIANDVDLPVIEYAHQTSTPHFADPVQGRGVIWFDTERHPSAFLSFILHPKRWKAKHWRPRFPYWDRSDLAPFFRSLLMLWQNLWTRLWRRLHKGCWS